MALAKELKELSLFDLIPNIEFTKTAALLSAKLTISPFFGKSKISYGIQVKEGFTPNDK